MERPVSADEVVERACTKCGVVKKLEEFRKNPSGKYGRSARCAVCLDAYDKAYYEANKEKWQERERLRREEDPEALKTKNREAAARHRANPENTIRLRYMKTRYGITPEQFLEMEKGQGGVCAICGGPPTGRYKRFHVDHDHATGKVRGLLCFMCNILLGNARDKPGILEAAVVYLARPQTQSSSPRRGS